MSTIDKDKIIQSYAFYISMLLGLIVGILCIYLGVVKGFEILTSVGSGILASTLFAIIFNIFSNKEMINLIRSQIRESSFEAANHVVESTKYGYQKFYPNKTYFSRYHHFDEYNHDLTEDLARSSFFYFWGATGRYAPYRLTEKYNSVKDVKILMIDINCLQSVRYRALDRIGDSASDNQKLEEEISNLKDEIIMSIIALFDNRGVRNIEIAFESSTSAHRCEIFGDSLYFAVYQTENLPKAKYPDAVKFNRDSYFYTTFHVDFDRRFRSFSKKYTFNSSSNISHLEKVLKDIDYKSHTNKSVNDYRKMYQKFLKEIKSQQA